MNIQTFRILFKMIKYSNWRHEKLHSWVTCKYYTTSHFILILCWNLSWVLFPWTSWWTRPIRYILFLFADRRQWCAIGVLLVIMLIVIILFFVLWELRCPLRGWGNGDLNMPSSFLKSKEYTNVLYCKLTLLNKGKCHVLFCVTTRNVLLKIWQEMSSKWSRT